ncbi:MAG TPA: c-type cytochrome [Sphingobium sp.]|nr:c-type cytochrome [Sphingobium sp.]
MKIGIFALAASAVLFATAAGAGPVPSIMKGVYTAAQAQRGQPLIAENCAQCHGASLRGGSMAPPLIGPTFLGQWQGKSVDELIRYVQTTMPPGQTGNLSRQEYADVVAVVLQRNGFPSGGGVDLSAANSGSRAIIPGKR